MSAGRAKRLIVSFKKPEDPSPEQTSLVHKAVGETGGARVVDEFPGTIQIEVGEDVAGDLAGRVAALEHWDVVDEGKVEMPDVPGRFRKRRK
jgi:hypothetical protein